MSALLSAVTTTAAPTVRAATSNNKSGSAGGTILLIVVIVLFLGFLLYNGRRKAKLAAAAAPSWEVGSTIVTRAGLIATLVVQTDDYVVLQLEDGTRARFVPQAVARVWEEPGSEQAPDDASALDGDDDTGEDGPVNLRKDRAEDSDDGRSGGEPPAGRGPLAD